jgi:hypothetical protein
VQFLVRFGAGNSPPASRLTTREQCFGFDFASRLGTEQLLPYEPNISQIQPRKRKKKRSRRTRLKRKRSEEKEKKKRQTRNRNIAQRGSLQPTPHRPKDHLINPIHQIPQPLQPSLLLLLFLPHPAPCPRRVHVLHVPARMHLRAPALVHCADVVSVVVACGNVGASSIGGNWR